MTGKSRMRMIPFVERVPGSWWKSGLVRLELRTEPVTFGYWYLSTDFLSVRPVDEKTLEVAFQIPEKMWRAFVEGRLLLEGVPFVPDGLSAAPAAEIFWYFRYRPHTLKIIRRRSKSQPKNEGGVL